MLDIAFEAEIIEWRGPAPYLFAPVPEELTGEIRFAASVASYGWGVVPVRARASGIIFQTSLFPRDGGYLVPIKRAVQNATGLAIGDRIRVELLIAAR
ncbi:MAG: DUF1905 domain-containing protein [Sphingomonadales bacterium]|nr:DUF1905 domain-containing protein [Sphingomonadales bacterium]